MLNEKIVNLLNKQINLELFSSYLYLEIANYFMDEGLAGFSHWFNVQVQEELEHTQLILTYLQDNGIKIKLEGIDNPTRDYGSHLEALEEALSHEKEITKAIHNIYDLAMEHKDFRTMQFLNWFVEEQAEEEASASELVEKYKMFGEGKRGLYGLDKEMGSRPEL